MRHLITNLTRRAASDRLAFPQPVVRVGGCRSWRSRRRIRMALNLAQAAAPLSQVIRPTALIDPRFLSDRLSAQVTLASETFQHTGSFKFRGAYNVALHAPQNEVIAASSGNFGQALAYACKLLGKKCTVVMRSEERRVGKECRS